jgi:hypothetical protein
MCFYTGHLCQAYDRVFRNVTTLAFIIFVGCFFSFSLAFLQRVGLLTEFLHNIF